MRRRKKIAKQEENCEGGKKIAKQEENCEGGKSANKRQIEVLLEGKIAQDA